jgi:hypothetical protein
MKGIWRKCLGLSLGALLGPAQAAEPPADSLDRSPPPIIARSQPANERQESLNASPPAVNLGRPRPVASSSEGVQQASFRGEGPDLGLTIARSATGEHQPMPPGPGTGGPPVPMPSSPGTGGPPVIETLPPPSPAPSAPTAGPTKAVVVMPPGVSPEFAASWNGFGAPATGHGVPGWTGPGCCVDNDDHLFYLQNEYLLWWVRGTRVPPLVTSPSLAPAAPLGAMAGGTAVLFGGSEFDTDSHSGYRLRAGLWLNRDHALGIEGSFFFLGKNDGNFMAASNGSAILTVPFVNATTRMEDAQVLAMPGVAQGAASSTIETRLWGSEANLRTSLLGGPGGHLDLLAGFRALGLDDNFQFNGVTSSLVPGTMGTAFQDRFSTRNRFYGGQIGANAEWRWGRLSLDLTGKVALGGTRERVEIGGNNLTGAVWSTGGFFAQPSNIGTFRRDRFAVVPELGVNVGYQLNEALRVYAGYNFLYWSAVARPGEQIDRVVNQPQVPGVPAVPARPAFVFRGSDFWAHGMNLGLEWRY